MANFSLRRHAPSAAATLVAAACAASALSSTSPAVATPSQAPRGQVVGQAVEGRNYSDSDIAGILSVLRTYPQWVQAPTLKNWLDEARNQGRPARQADILRAFDVARHIGWVMPGDVERVLWVHFDSQTAPAPSPAPAPTTPVAPAPAPLPALTPGGTAFPQRIFADGSFWYRKLPNNAPLDTGWQGIADAMRIQTSDGMRAMVNTEHFSAPLFVARNSDAVTTVQWRDCRGDGEPVPGMREGLANVHVPAGFGPAGGEDGEAVVYNADTGRYTEFSRLQRGNDGVWSACGGGNLTNARSTDGIMPKPFGSAASGLPYAGGAILPEELRAGHIPHVVGIALPYAKPGQYSWPAWQTDGRNPQGIAAPMQGQLLRLPADLDIDSLNLHPVARTIAKAAQEYGLVVWDTAGAVSFRAQNPKSLPANPYPSLFVGGDGWTALHGRPQLGEKPFPFDKLQAVAPNYGR